MRKLTVNQKKILNQQTTKGVTNWDELPIEVIEQLEAINDTEILWQEVNRYLIGWIIDENGGANYSF